LLVLVIQRGHTLLVLLIQRGHTLLVLVIQRGHTIERPDEPNASLRINQKFGQLSQFRRKSPKQHQLPLLPSSFLLPFLHSTPLTTLLPFIIMSANVQSLYSSHLMGAFELQYRRTDETLKSTLEVSTYFRKLADVEADYVKALMKLGQAEKKLFKTAGKQTEKEIGTLRDCWETLNNEIDNIANRHQLFATQIIANVSQEIADYVKEKEVERKRLVTEGMKCTKDYKDVITALKKAQATYYSKCREAETAQQQHEKAKTDPSIKPKELNKFLSKSQKAMEVATAADAEYKKMIKKANSKQSKFYELEMPALLKDFQTFEEDRITFLKNMFNKFLGFWNELPPFLQTTMSNIQKSADLINKDTDIKQFATENQTNFVIPAEIHYEPFPDNPNFGQTPPPSTSVPLSTPSKPMSQPEIKVFGLTDADAHLSKDARIQKLKDQYTELRNAIRLENKSRQGLERLVKFYKSMDPQAQEVSRDKLEEQTRKLESLRESRARVVQQLAELGVQVPPSAGEDDETAIPAGHSVVPTTDQNPPPPPIVKARCLYDYEATNDSELSFNEGDILTITEQDESGWWYAELNGLAGFVPNNYVVLV